jgi:hypothetical protein
VIGSHSLLCILHPETYDLEIVEDALKLNLSNTANEGPVRIQHKCIYVFPEMKLYAASLFPKQSWNF